MKIHFLWEKRVSVFGLSVKIQLSFKVRNYDDTPKGLTKTSWCHIIYDNVMVNGISSHFYY